MLPLLYCASSAIERYPAIEAAEVGAVWLLATEAAERYGSFGPYVRGGSIL